MPSDKIYNFYCLICGDPFKVTRVDAHTCSKNCRVALHKLKKFGQQLEPTTPEEDKDIKAKMDSVTSGGAKAALTPSHDEGKKSTIPSQTQQVLDDIKNSGKSKRKKGFKPDPKNDRNLIPGKAGKDQNRLNKSRKKAKKGGSGE